MVGQDPDVTLVALVVAGERFALDATTATIDRHGDLAALLAGARDAHQAHVTLLADAAPEQATGRSPSPTGSASPTADPATRSFGVPARPRAALRGLASMELDLSLADKRHAFAAESGAFARILASMAASAAQHAVLLGEATATTPERP